MKKKSFFQSWWFWLIIAGVILLAGNIAVLLWVKDNNVQGAWLTLFSGWVSGLATIILGVIAVWQNRKYKEENDKFIEYQQQRDWRIEQKDLIKMYLENIKQVYDEVKKYQYSTIINELTKNKINGTFTIDEKVYDEKLNNIKDSIIYATADTLYYFDGVEKLMELCCDYTVKLRNLIQDFEQIIKNNDTNRFVCLDEMFQDLNTEFNQHILQVQLFVSMIMSNSNYDEVKKQLEDKQSKQIEWFKRREKTMEEQNNG